jgi:biopolymer transport protein ExbD
MKKSHRARRMDRRHRRRTLPAINLVSLMDIFTILVFFLLVNSSQTVQPNTRSIQLPKSISEQLPRETLNIMVTEADVLVNGRLIARIEDILRSGGDTIPALQQELRYQADRNPVLPGPDGLIARDITIMGDKEIPYRLLRMIMFTCSQNEYSNISLAVLKRSGEDAS